MTDREVGARACEIALPLWERGCEVRWRREFNAMTEIDCLLFEIHRDGSRYGCGVSVLAMERMIRPDLLAPTVLRQIEDEFARGSEQERKDNAPND